MCGRSHHFGVVPNSASVGFRSPGPGTARNCTPRKTGTVLEQSWNLLLLGCKAGLIQVLEEELDCNGGDWFLNILRGAC